MRSGHFIPASLALALALSGAACTESPTSPSSVATTAKTAAAKDGTTSAQTPPRDPTAAAKAGQNTNGYSLHFGGSAGTDEEGRVKVQIDPHVPADVGADFTIEFWMKAEPVANASASCQTGEDGWRYGNVIVDRSIAPAGPGLAGNGGGSGQGSYGISVSGGRIAFGVSTERGSQTVCGLIDVTDGRWHHVAATRRSGDGQLRVYVDGTESAQGHGPLGDVSYRSTRASAGVPDPMLIIGGAKPVDATISAQAQMPAFSGWLDDFRISPRVRYFAPFDRPTLPFTPDADTALLYHFDEGPVGACGSTMLDGSGHSVHGQCRAGGVANAPAYDGDNPFAAVNPARVTTKSWLQD